MAVFQSKNHKGKLKSQTRRESGTESYESCTHLPKRRIRLSVRFMEILGKTIGLPPFSRSLEERLMKASKCLIAVFSLIAVAGADAATVATYNVTSTLLSAVNPYAGISRGTANRSVSSTVVYGTAVLDSFGTLTISTPSHLPGTKAGKKDSAVTFSGSWNGTSFTPHSITPPACVGIECRINQATQPTVFSVILGSLTIADGSFEALISRDPYLLQTVRYKLTNDAGGGVKPAPSPVPVPAAAWLFGSGLLGLAGAARRRATAKAKQLDSSI